MGCKGNAAPRTHGGPHPRPSLQSSELLTPKLPVVQGHGKPADLAFSKEGGQEEGDQEEVEARRWGGTVSLWESIRGPERERGGDWRAPGERRYSQSSNGHGVLGGLVKRDLGLLSWPQLGQ